MKNIKKSIVIFCLIFGIFSCGKKANPSDFEFVDSVTCLSEKSYRYIVSNRESTIDFDTLIKENGGCNYYLTDYETEQSVSKSLILNEGDNKYHLHVESEIWNLNVYRYHLYTVSFDAGDSYIFNDVTVEENQTINPPVVVKEGYSCSWDYDFSNPITSSFTAHIVFTPNEYKINLDPNGGTIDQSVLSVLYDSLYELPTPERQGYEFLGWTDSQGTEVTSGVYKNTHSIELIANWKIITYSIEYRYENAEAQGTFVYSYTVEDQIVLPSLAMLGCTFKGWKDQNGNDYDGKISVGTTGNLILSPRFDLNEYKVTFDVGEGFASQKEFEEKVLYKSLIPEPETPCSNDKLFEGWFLGDKKWDFENDKMPYNDITLIARYYIPEESNASDFTFKYVDELVPNGYMVTSYTGNSKIVRVPDTYNSKPVIGVYHQGFMASEIEKLYFGTNAAHFYPDSFSYSSKLKELVFSASDYYLYRKCLYKASAIENIYFANHVRFYGEYTETDAPISNCNIKRMWFDDCTLVNYQEYCICNLLNLEDVYVSNSIQICFKNCNTFNLHVVENKYVEDSKKFYVNHDHYLYYEDKEVKNIKYITFDGLGDVSCLNEFDSVILDEFTEPLIYYPPNAKAVKYTNYQSKNFQIYEGHYTHHEKLPLFLFVPNGIRLLKLNSNITTWGEEKTTSLVIPSDVQIIDSVNNCFDFVFIDKEYDESLVEAFNKRSAVYWKGQWKLNQAGHPVVII